MQQYQDRRFVQQKTRETSMTDLNDYPVTITIPVSWGEMDSFGHVNNIIYFRYFESARIKYFEEIALIDHMKETGVGPIMAKTSCDFKKPLQYPDTIVAGARVKSLGKSSFVMEYIVVSEKSGVAAKGEGVLVIFDYNKSIKVEMPDSIKESIMSLEGKNFE